VKDLFFAVDLRPAVQPLGPEAKLLCGFALPDQAALWTDLAAVIEQAPFRAVTTPGGQPMSAALTACGSWGWHADRKGYRYVDRNPQTGELWPAMPDSFLKLAQTAAFTAGFGAFEPDACLMNRYLPGGKMGLHQDLDERDLSQPIVSVSLGLPAVFVFGGLQRTGPKRKVELLHGDVVVWGGGSRLCYHGVLPVAEGRHPLVGSMRINLTFRKAM
jgi:alkylated DNA repair protein (DNA oxidative demethylase)